MTRNSQPKIVELKPMTVASYTARGTHPEKAAFKEVHKWVTGGGVPGHEKPRYFGFDNPPPSAGKDEYGYEVWATAPPCAAGSGPVKIKQFSGGLYAVMRTDLATIGQSWKDLIAWREASSYKAGSHRCLEEHLTLPVDNPDDAVKIDLYLPISK